MQIANYSQFTPLVIGIPRSGFSLLLSILSNLLHHAPCEFSPYARANRLFSDSLGCQISTDIIKIFQQHGLEAQMLYNKNFRHCVGGPRWNDDLLGRKAYFRKYIGIKDQGDFTLIISHPLTIFKADTIIHSHGPFKDWVDVEPFKQKQLMASIRNPAGIINSASHSLNALTSEYIQKWVPDLDVEKTRIELAGYKLTDMSFFNALLQPLKRGFLDLLKVKENFYIVPWEDMITRPEATIFKITQDFSLPISRNLCENIWRSIAFRNLTGDHKHNYRVGKAYVGDENESLTNHHIELMKSEGFDELMTEFGYPQLAYFDESNYTNFQKLVDECIVRGEIHDGCEDRFLFDLAFNKSNIDFSIFGFRQYDWRTHTRVERSNIADPTLELAVWDAAEAIVGEFNFLHETLNACFSFCVPFETLEQEILRRRDSFSACDLSSVIEKLKILYDKNTEYME